MRQDIRIDGSRAVPRGAPQAATGGRDRAESQVAINDFGGKSMFRPYTYEYCTLQSKLSEGVIESMQREGWELIGWKAISDHLATATANGIVEIVFKRMESRGRPTIAMT